MGLIFRVFILLLLALIGIFAALTVVVKPNFEPWLERHIRFELKAACPACEFSMEDVTLSWDGFGLQKVHFTTGTGQQRLEAEIATIYLYPNVTSLLNGKPRLQNITFDQPKMIFHDEGEKSAQKQSESSFALPPHLHIQIDNGDFTYIRDVKNTHATLTIEHIQALIGPEADLLRARATAQLGQTESLNLTVSADLHKNPLEATIEMRAKDQDMKVLSDFFEPNAGVKMEGILIAGHVVSQLKGTHVSTQLTMEFKDFKLKVKPMYDRDGVQAFFTNLAAAVALKKKNVGAQEKEKTESIETDREGQESLVSLVLRSWKEAALKIVR